MIQIELEASMSSRRLTNKRNGNITVEVSMSIALGLIALFLVFGLFNDNLSSMAAHSGIQNLFKRQSPSTSDWGKTNVKTPITLSDEHVQTVGVQGLDWYLAQAQATINKYNGRTNLTQAESEDLAKSLMIARMTGLTTDSSGQTIDYVNFYKNNGIMVVKNDGVFTTKVKFGDVTKSLSYNSESNSDQLLAVQTISKGVFK